MFALLLILVVVLALFLVMNLAGGPRFGPGAARRGRTIIVERDAPPDVVVEREVPRRRVVERVVERDYNA
ncbi:MAG TPA: hypothetical protein VHD87_03785 [Acidimicrobiales bacterium]|nr:hypothetical protein [Acidimicrobiales bacterium]